MKILNNSYILLKDRSFLLRLGDIPGKRPSPRLWGRVGR